MNSGYFNEPHLIKNADKTKTPYAVSLEKNTKKRRISFSGRKSVREFHPEEKPRSWDDSYEISDYTNMSQNMSAYMNSNIYSEENDGGQSNRLDSQSHPKDMKAHRQCTSNNLEKKWESEEKISGGTTFLDNDITMDISTKLNNLKKCKDNCTVNSATITERTGLISGKGQSPTHSRNIFPSDMYNSTISTNPIPKPVCHDYEYEITKPQNPEHFSDTGFEVDFTRCECNSSFTNTCNFFYPPTKTLKLNLRQLNAAIGDGKIVVFPEKHDPDLKVHSFVKCSETEGFTGQAKNFQVKNFPNISHNSKKQYIGDIPIELQRTRLLDANDTSNRYDGSEWEDISLNNSVIANEKLDSSSISEGYSKCDKKRKLSIGTLLRGPVYTKEITLKPYTSPTISSLSYTPPVKYDGYNKSFIDRTLVAVQDMSLDITNFETKQDCLHRSIPHNTIEINTNYSRQAMELDIITDMNIKKSEDTIIFNQGTQFLITNDVFEKEKSGTKTDKAVCINDDSFIWNPKEFRRAECFGNHERRIEGTPHRSILEFVNLEKEAQQEGDDHNEYMLFQTNEKPKQNNQKSFEENDSLKCYEMSKAFEDPRPIDVLDNSLARSPVWNSDSSKRLTEHLTPNLPLPKRRHTLLFPDCAIDESILLSSKFDFANNTCFGLLNQTGLAQGLNLKRSNQINSLSQNHSLKRLHGNETIKKNKESLGGFEIEHIGGKTDFVKCQAFQASLSIATEINAITSVFLHNKNVECGTMAYHEYAIQVTGREHLRDSICIDPLAPLIVSPNTTLCEVDNYKSLTNGCEDNAITVFNTSVHDTPLTVGVSCQQKASETMESFALPSTSQFPSLPFGRLEKFRKNSNLESAHEYWRRRSLEKEGTFFFDSAKQSNESCKTCWGSTNCIGIDHFLATIEDLKKSLKQVKDLDVPEQLQKDCFFDNLSELLRTGLPNWILNRQLKAKRVIQFYNKKLISCVIEIIYDGQDLLRNEVFVQNVTLQKVKSNNFKPFDYILHAALNGSLALSLNPWQSGITKSEEISKLLKLANKSCDQVFNDSISLWQLICKMRASLIRQSNRTIVRKVVRGLIYEDDCPLVITTEFQVEIRNIQTLSFSDIKAPPLYDFCKQLESLPRGIDFLKVFLENPIHYLHRRTRQ